MTYKRLQPIRGSRYTRSHRYQKREHPEFVLKVSISGYYQVWKFLTLIKAFYTTTLPTSSGTMPLNLKQCRYHNLFREGLRIECESGIGKKHGRGRPPKVATEYKLLADIRGFDKSWTLTKVYSVSKLPSQVELSNWDLEEFGFTDLIGKKLHIPEGLGVHVE